MVALGRVPVRPEVRHVRQARVLRHPQQRGVLRLLAAVQVLGARPGRRAVPRRRAGAGRPDLPHRAVRSTRSGATTPATSSRTASSSGTPTTSSCSPRRSRTSATCATSSAASTSRSSTSRQEYGVLAVQGPRSREILAHLSPDVAALPYFGHVQTKVGAASVTVSRTGFTGDLGYEILVPAADALPVLDAVIEAGTPLRDAAFRRAGAAHGADRGRAAARRRRLLVQPVRVDRPRPGDPGRARAALDAARASTTRIGRSSAAARCATRSRAGRRAGRRSGIVVDWQDWDRVWTQAGLVPPKDETPLDYESMLYDADGGRVGYATSLMYSPALQRHIGIARVRPDHGAVGSTVGPRGHREPPVRDGRRAGGPAPALQPRAKDGVRR